MNKLTDNLRQAIIDSGLKSGMTVSFHHHLRNGDYVLNMVMEEIRTLGLKDIKINASAIMDVHEPLVELIKTGVVTGIETAYMGAAIGHEVSKGILPTPVIFRTHGGRAGAVETGESPIDVAFIAASAADAEGNCTGLTGPAAFGGMGYAVADSLRAAYKIAITDTLIDSLDKPSIPGERIDRIVKVDSIGDPNGIVSGTTRITKSPTRLKIAADTVKIMEAAGLLHDGLRFQTGAGGVTLAVAKYMRDKMLEKGIRGDFCLGGITGYMVGMLHEGCFDRILNAQCFDREAIESLKNDETHFELSCGEYASPANPDSLARQLDAVMLGATEIDFDFNVNVHTDSFGRIMGGSGGHSDTAEGAEVTFILAPLMRGRISVIREKVTAISTPGRYVDILVTEYGAAVNPARPELKEKLLDCGVKILDIKELYDIAVRLGGVPEPIRFGDKQVAKIVYRDGSVIDTIRAVED